MKRLTKPAAEMLKLLKAYGTAGCPEADLVVKWIDYNQLVTELVRAGYAVVRVDGSYVYSPARG